MRRGGVKGGLGGVDAQALNRSAHLTLQRPDAHVLLVELLLLESDALQEVVDASVLRLEHYLGRRNRRTTNNQHVSVMVSVYRAVHTYVQLAFQTHFSYEY